MPKKVEIRDLACYASNIHRITVSVEAERTVLQFGRSSFNRSFKIMVKYDVTS